MKGSSKAKTNFINKGPQITTSSQSKTHHMVRSTILYQRKSNKSLIPYWLPDCIHSSPFIYSEDLVEFLTFCECSSMAACDSLARWQSAASSRPCFSAHSSIRARRRFSLTPHTLVIYTYNCQYYPGWLPQL